MFYCVFHIFFRKFFIIHFRLRKKSIIISLVLFLFLFTFFYNLYLIKRVMFCFTIKIVPKLCLCYFVKCLCVCYWCVFVLLLKNLIIFKNFVGRNVIKSCLNINKGIFLIYIFIVCIYDEVTFFYFYLFVKNEYFFN